MLTALAVNYQMLSVSEKDGITTQLADNVGMSKATFEQCINSHVGIADFVDIVHSQDLFLSIIHDP